MAVPKTLTGEPRPIEIAPGGFTLMAPGIQGTVVELSEGEQTRASGLAADGRLAEALKGADVETMKIFDIRIVADRRSASGSRAAGAAWTTRGGEPAFALSVPDLGEEKDYAVLYTDEAGVQRWILPASREPAAVTSRGSGAEVLFLIPRESAATPEKSEEEDSTSRGRIIALGRRLVRVLVWATDMVVGAGLLAVATKWEQSRRPYGLHHLPFDGSAFDWGGLKGGRALLLIHGTFSSALGSFGPLPKALLDELLNLYQGRVFAFDHPSLHQTPEQNAQEFLARIPAGQELEVDLVTHSRGGLVGRELAMRSSPGGCGLTVHKAVLVASPNHGTVLADGAKLMDLLDRYTNLLVHLPDTAFTLTMEGILMAVKLVAHAAFATLPGLRSMYPEGDYLGRLNPGSPHATRYYAFAADFKPTAPGLLALFGWRAADALVDSVFGEANDGVVPTRGSYDIGVASPIFPIPDERRFVFGADEQVHHCNYFQSPHLADQLVRWLSTL